MAEERDRENENSNQKQEDQMQKNKASTSGKEKVNDNSSDQHSTKKTKVDNVLKNNGEDESTEREEEGIMHDTINAESYKKYFENICKLLKPNSVIIIDKVSYHSINTEDFPVSKWRKAQFQSWLTENKIPFKPDALRSELWTLFKKYRTDKTSKVIANIAKKYGHEVIRLPPYHCDLNAIELIWADEKNYVALENREMTLKSVEALFRERRSQLLLKSARNVYKCIEHVKKVELSYWKTDRIIDQKMDQLEIALDANEDESDIETDSAGDEHEQ